MLRWVRWFAQVGTRWVQSQRVQPTRRNDANWFSRHKRAGQESRYRAGKFEFLEDRRLLSVSYPLSSTPLEEVSLDWGRLFGGAVYEETRSLSMDPSGNLFLGGTSWSPDWVSGGSDTTLGGEGDAFLIKFSPTGEHLWSTYFGGEKDDGITGVVTDASGNVYIAGWTRSPGWVSGGYDTTYGGMGDGFVAKLSPAGDLLWATYLGGSEWDGVNAMCMAPDGDLFVTGTTRSSGWGRNGFDSYYNGGMMDGFAAKISPTGQLRWSTFLGGDTWDFGYAVAASSDALYVVGKTASTNWLSGGFDLTSGGDYDGFLMRLSLTGQHVWSTYLGGQGEDAALAVAANSEAVFVGGDTTSLDLPASNGPIGGRDAFLVAVSPSGELLWEMYLGGEGDDSINALALSSENELWAGGSTSSDGWIPNAPSQSRFGEQDGFIVLVDCSNQTPVLGQYLGGDQNDSVMALAAWPGGLAASGVTYSHDWLPDDPFGIDFDDPNSFAAVFNVIAPQQAEIVDLGELDYQIVAAAVGQANTIYQFTATHDAMLTLAAAADAETPFQVQLFDVDPVENLEAVPVASGEVSDHSQILELASLQSGQTYYLVVESGGGVGFTLANLHAVAVDQHHFFGTQADDSFAVSWYAAENGTLVATVSFRDLWWDVPCAAGQKICISAEAGDDMIVLDDTEADDVVEIWSDGLLFTAGTGQMVEADSFKTIHVYARNGGRDKATLRDVNRDGSRQLATKLKSEPEHSHVKLVSPSMYARVKFFEEIAVNVQGANDQAVLYSGSSSAHFILGYKESRVIDETYELMTVGFPFVLAYGASGNQLTITDSPMKDQLNFKAHKVEMFDVVTHGSRYSIVARGFSSTQAILSPTNSGRDKAAIWDTVFSDHIEITGDEVLFFRKRDDSTRDQLLQLQGFELVVVRTSSGGADTVTVNNPPFDFQLGLGWSMLWSTL